MTTQGLQAHHYYTLKNIPTIFPYWIKIHRCKGRLDVILANHDLRTRHQTSVKMPLVKSRQGSFFDFIGQFPSRIPYTVAQPVGELVLNLGHVSSATGNPRENGGFFLG